MESYQSLQKTDEKLAGTEKRTQNIRATLSKNDYETASEMLEKKLIMKGK